MSKVVVAWLLSYSTYKAYIDRECNFPLSTLANKNILSFNEKKKSSKTKQKQQ